MKPCKLNVICVFKIVVITCLIILSLFRCLVTVLISLFVMTVSLEKRAVYADSQLEKLKVELVTLRRERAGYKVICAD